MLIDLEGGRKLLYSDFWLYLLFDLYADSLLEVLKLITFHTKG